MKRAGILLKSTWTKSKALFRMFIFILLFPPSVLSQWVQIEIQTDAGFNGLCFTDSITGYAIGGEGTILRTINGGETWSPLHAPTTESLTEICFPTPQTGYIVGNYGTVLKTEDAGYSWFALNPNYSYHLRGVYFLNADTGFYSCADGIARTDNGGYTWNFVADSWYWLRRFHFTTPEIGYCAGDIGQVFKTFDGGLFWYELYTGTDISFYDVCFPVPDTGYISGNNGLVMKSTDGGLNWFPVSPGPVQPMRGLYFFNADSGYVVGSAGLIFRTGDGGLSWTAEFSGTENALQQITFTQDGFGFICGFYGTILSNNILLGEDLPDRESIISVYPNPTYGPVIIKNPCKLPLTNLLIYDSKGVLIRNTTLDRMQSVNQVDFTFGSGCYFINLRGADLNLFKKIIVLNE